MRMTNYNLNTSFALLHEIIAVWLEQLGLEEEASLSKIAFNSIEPLDIGMLSCADTQKYYSIQSEKRREDFLLGRDALHKLGFWHKHLVFPHKELSLSHTEGLAIAWQVLGASGIGVDVEKENRPVSVKLLNRICQSCELDEIKSMLTPLQIWGIKEACFKANQNNARTSMIQYRISRLRTTEIAHTKFQTAITEISGGLLFECISILINGFQTAWAISLPARH